MPVSGEFIVVARIARPQGRHGEVLAEILTDFPDKFSERAQLWLGREHDESRQPYRLLDHWCHKGRVVLKYAGVDSISDAQLLTGSLVQIPFEKRAELSTGAVYVSDLVGSVLVDVLGGRQSKVGMVEDVRQGVGAAPLLVVRSHDQEYEIPFAEEYLVRFDAAMKVLEMKLPSGLLEVNAPLSDEKKDEK